MYNSMKPGGGGEMQPYVPKGNGDKSGEYTDKPYESFDHYSRRVNAKIKRKDFLENNDCTAKSLSQVLTIDEINAVTLYSNYKVGTLLNKKIRDKTMSEEDEIFCNHLETAIRKNCIKQDVRVYRGISVPREIYETKFWLPYIQNRAIIGSRICSTSRSLRRALQGTLSKESGNVGIIFVCDIEKGRNALPIEDIAIDPSEQEVLLSSPMYFINNIREDTIKGKKIIRIDISLARY